MKQRKARKSCFSATKGLPAHWTSPTSSPSRPPSGWFKLYIPTTRSCRWPDIVIDGKGIAPQIPIPYEESQIEALQERDGIGEEIRYIERVLRGLPCPSAAEQ